MTMPLLEIENLSVRFPSHNAVMHAVEGVSLTLDEGEVLGIVGESGSGKTVTMLALMGLVAYPGQITADKLNFQGQNLLKLPDDQRRALIGKDLAMIFQEPTTSLNPCFTIGFQLAETLRLHLNMDKKSARKRAIELLEQVGISSPESRLKAYPHQLSGGMNQRVMIAMAIACNPKMLIADEPTTLVIDNAPIHTSTEFQLMIPEWERQNLGLWFLPAYSPELNLIEILWKKIKYDWLPLEAYGSFGNLKEMLAHVLANIGKEFKICFQ